MGSIRGARRWTACAATVVALATAAVALAAPAQALDTARWWGEDRHATAVEVSRGSFDGLAETVVVVNGTSFADALAAAPLAAAQGAPLLTVTAGGVPDATRAELVRLAPRDVLVVGGPAVVSDVVLDQLRGVAADVTRVSGTDRYDTARVIAETYFAGPVEEVFVASGENFPDALAAGAAGAALGAPLLLTSGGALSAPARAALGGLAPTRTTVVGGPAVVSAAVESELRATSTGEVVRLAGGDRYATAATVLLETQGSASEALLASGTNFPDALAGAATGQALLLSRPDCLPQVTADAYTAAGIISVTGLGGVGVLSDAALAGTVCGAAPAPPAPVPPPAPARPGDRNCSDFATWRAAQDWFDTYYPTYGDVAGLDADGNLIACESLPGAP